jgi:DNA-binding NarL/FixJ family response regulator
LALFFKKPFNSTCLTKREYETLIDLLMGVSIKSIACKKEISARTVEEYVLSLRKN